jgi:polysaccharide pyruvyl transferase WcaK-like protein
MIPEIERLDVFVLGGGGILYDTGAEEYLREVLIATELGVPVFVYAISAGPLTTQAARRAVREALNASPPPVVTVRDRLGLRLLEDVGVTHEIHLTADPAFLLEPEELSAEALRYDAEVLFVPMEITDVQHSHAVVAHMRNAEHAEILRRRYSPGQILHLMGRLEFAVGMRLHFLIFAAIGGTPFAALPYASKVTGLLEDLEMPTPPLGSVGIGQLIAQIDRSRDTRAEVREKIRERVPALRARAQRTNRLLLALLEDRRAPRAAGL